MMKSASFEAASTCIVISSYLWFGSLQNLPTSHLVSYWVSHFVSYWVSYWVSYLVSHFCSVTVSYSVLKKIKIGFCEHMAWLEIICNLSIILLPLKQSCTLIQRYLFKMEFQHSIYSQFGNKCHGFVRRRSSRYFCAKQNHDTYSSKIWCSSCNH